MEHEFAARERKRDFLYFHFWPWCYRLFPKRPVQKKLAVFANDCVRSLPDNMQCLYDELRRRGYRCILCLKPKHAGNRSAHKCVLSAITCGLSIIMRIAVVFFKRLLFPGLFRQAAEGTRVIQLWHACGALRSGAIPHSATLGAIRKAV